MSLLLHHSPHGLYQHHHDHHHRPHKVEAPLLSSKRTTGSFVSGGSPRSRCWPSLIFCPPPGQGNPLQPQRETEKQCGTRIESGGSESRRTRASANPGSWSDFKSGTSSPKPVTLSPLRHLQPFLNTGLTPYAMPRVSCPFSTYALTLRVLESKDLNPSRVVQVVVVLEAVAASIEFRDEVCMVQRAADSATL